MFSASSPQLMAVGEVQKSCTSDSNDIKKQSYATAVLPKQLDSSTLELYPVVVNKGVPVIQFTKDQVNNLIKEEGLHQAVVLKFSYGRPELSEVRRIFSSQFDVQGHCNIGHLEYRHLLVRFDLYNDYVQFLSKSAAILKAKSNEYFFRTFPWTLEFNPKEETPMAVVWISLPGLPPNFFAKRSLMSIASAVGKPLAIDKATKDRSRPSAARVKVIINLLDNHPSKIKLQVVDSITGKTIEFDQQIAFDNLPKYCTHCKHQGHEINRCRLINQNRGLEVRSKTLLEGDLVAYEVGKIDKLQGDARDFLNAKRLAQDAKVAQEKVATEGNGSKSNSNHSHSELAVNNKEKSAEPQEINNQVDITIQDSNVPMMNSAVIANSNRQDQETANNDYETGIHYQDAVLSEKDTVEVSESLVVNNKIVNVVEPQVSHYIDVANLACKSPIQSSEVTANKAQVNAKGITVSTKSGIVWKDKEEKDVVELIPIVEIDEHQEVNTQNEVQKMCSQHSNQTSGSTVQIDSQQVNVLKPRPELLVMDKRENGNSKLIIHEADSIAGCNEQETINDQVVANFVYKAASNVQQIVVAAKDRVEFSETRDANNQISTVCFNPVFEIPLVNAANQQDFPTQIELNNLCSPYHNPISDSSDQFDQGKLKGQKIQSVLNVLDKGEFSVAISNSHDAVSVEVYKQLDNASQNSRCPLTSPSSDHTDKECPDSNGQQTRVKERNNHVSSSKEIVLPKRLYNAITKMEKQPKKSTVSLKYTKFSDFKFSLAHSSHEQGSSSETIFGSFQQHPTRFTELIEARSFFGSLSGKQQIQTIKDSVQQQVVSPDSPVVNPVLEEMQPVADYFGENQSVNSQDDQGKTSSQKSRTKNASLDRDSILHTRTKLKNISDPKVPKRAKSSKPTLWKDQGDFDDEETWGEGLASFSWEEEDQGSGEDSDDSIEQKIDRKIAEKNTRAKANLSANSNRRLNHNAPVYVPANNAKAVRSLEVTSIVNSNPTTDINTADLSQMKQLVTVDSEIASEEKQSCTGEHCLEEGEEEEFINQCRANASIKGDLSPMHSAKSRKPHQRERSWDGNMVELRKPPMRIAKQKQAAQPNIQKSNRMKKKS